MQKIISIGIILYVVFTVFSNIGKVSQSSVFSVGDAFSVLGVMVVWSIITLAAYKDFTD
tara:strand:- start:1510 stop:1686 length:177 start_codon:yes stop_codon:yes gene_type:complete